MSEVKRYTPSMRVGGMVKDKDGLWVRSQDFDRVTAERNEAIEDRDAWKGAAETFEDFYRKTEAERDAALGREDVLREELAKAKKLNIYKHAALVSKDKALTEADERSDMLEVAIRKIKARLDAYSEADMRMPESSVEVCQMIADAALKPAEGGGDEA